MGVGALPSHTFRPKVSKRLGLDGDLCKSGVALDPTARLLPTGFSGLLNRIVDWAG